jgi:hypothetical protein
MTVISSIQELRSLYRQPSSLVRGKVQPALDEVSIAFIAHCPFVVIATCGADGRVDVSPRGGPMGFVRVLDGGLVAIPDLNGNNLLDTLENIVSTGEAGTLFVVPGTDETLRVNGRAWVSVEAAVLDGFDPGLRRPKSAIVIDPREVFIHCAKAFRRGRVWEPESWPSGGPDGVDILRCQLGLQTDVDALRSSFAEGYARDLAADCAE